jgi:alpha-tubulin suppressor-like RCC1 family protein
MVCSACSVLWGFDDVALAPPRGRSDGGAAELEGGLPDAASDAGSDATNDGIVAVVAAARGSHSCALIRSGALKCWGNNEAGQLGDGTANNSSVPVDVIGMNMGVQTMSAGGGTTCAVTREARAICWGSNSRGQLGPAATGAGSATPVEVTGLADVAMVSVGSSHACAVTATGAVWCWGNNNAGQLGNNATTDSPSPVLANGLGAGAASVSAGRGHVSVRPSAGGSGLTPPRRPWLAAAALT